MNNAEFIIVNIVCAKWHFVNHLYPDTALPSPPLTARQIAPGLCRWIELITLYLQCLHNIVQLRYKKPYIHQPQFKS